MKHYNHAGLRRGAPPHTEPIYLPMDTTDKPTYPKHCCLPVISFSVLALLLSGGIASATPLTQKTDLGITDPNDAGYESDTTALSHDGSVVGGNIVHPGSGEGPDGSVRTYRAVLWTGPGWTTRIDLGTLKSDNSGSASVSSLSADGTLVGGSAVNDNGVTRAVIWSGPGWTTKTDLGTLKSDNSGSSYVNALSGDGSVAGGSSAVDGRSENQATIWSGPGWATRTALGTLKSDGSGSGSVEALSTDGSVAAGNAGADTLLGSAPVIWSGNNWSEKTQLRSPSTPAHDRGGTLYTLSGDGRFAGGQAWGDGSGYSAVIWKGDDNWAPVVLPGLTSSLSGGGMVNGLSDDGRRVAGSVSSGNGIRPVLWSGTDWSVVTDLGTLRSDNGGTGKASEMSTDGTVIAGQTDADNG